MKALLLRIPPAFPESTLTCIECAQYYTFLTAQSIFNSWAASLHFVVCYATYLGTHTNPHVTGMDTCEVEDEVFIWHVPHLLGGKSGHYEYLAHGRIRGNGYYALSSRKLEQNGVLGFFPGIHRLRAV
jgi:hypothetical protein